MSSRQNGSESDPGLILVPADPYEEWLSLAVPEPSPDPRFEVRRAEDHEYELVYDCVDAAFGKKRPRAVYDWLYRDNPYGRAQCWITIEQCREQFASGYTLASTLDQRVMDPVCQCSN